MRLPAPIAFAISAALHAAAVLAMTRLPPVSRAENVPIELVEVAPPPPPPEPEAPPPEPAPQPEPPAPVARPARRAPDPAPPPPRNAPPPPPEQAAAPPPPNAPPPIDAPSPSRAPVKIGIAMSSSTTGGMPAPAGNTLYGAMPRRAPAPEEVKPYASERYVPPTQVTVLPRPLGPCVMGKEDYPDGALRLGIEGRVILLVTIDETGAVVDARVVQDPGHGLGEAAARAYKRRCRFEPGRRGDQRVATTIRVGVSFEMP